MLTQPEHQTVTHYVSEVLPEVTTQDPDLAKTIAWADTNHVVWKIVTNTRSKAFGRTGRTPDCRETSGYPRRRSRGARQGHSSRRDRKSRR